MSIKTDKGSIFSEISQIAHRFQPEDVKKRWLTARVPDNFSALKQGLDQQVLLQSPLIVAWTVAGLKRLFNQQQTGFQLFSVLFWSSNSLLFCYSQVKIL